MVFFAAATFVALAAFSAVFRCSDVCAPNFFVNRSTRPSVSISFWRPVKNGWQAEQISRCSSGLVERVLNVLPHAHRTSTSLYVGVNAFFHDVLLAAALTAVRRPLPSGPCQAPSCHWPARTALRRSAETSSIPSGPPSAKCLRCAGFELDEAVLRARGPGVGEEFHHHAGPQPPGISRRHQDWAARFARRGRSASSIPVPSGISMPTETGVAERSSSSTKVPQRFATVMRTGADAASGWGTQSRSRTHRVGAGPDEPRLTAGPAERQPAQRLGQRRRRRRIRGACVWRARARCSHPRASTAVPARVQRDHQAISATAKAGAARAGGRPAVERRPPTTPTTTRRARRTTAGRLGSASACRGATRAPSRSAAHAAA